tara:strand:- start:8 stop:622 length:615 start_codon:yes stop_codon:yes gene_type:complete
MVYLIIIGGNIGSGKSTVIRGLEEKGIECVREPIEKWQPWLNKFYEDPKKYSMGFQLQIIKEFYKILKDKKDKKLYLVMERGMYDSIHIFAKNLKNNNMLSDYEYNMILEYYEIMNINEPSLYIYIHTKPSLCMERIKTRNRECEQEIKIEYLEEINSLYEEEFNKENCNFLIEKVDGNDKIENVLKKTHTCILNNAGWLIYCD